MGTLKYIPVFALLGFPRKPAGFRENPSASFDKKYAYFIKRVGFSNTP